MLFGIMQSPLYNPDASTKDTAVFCRIVALRPTDGRTAQYLYPLEDPGNVVSELCVLGGGDLLVLERDAEFPAEGRGFKKVFRIDLSQASDISPLDGYMAVDTLAPGMASGPWRRSFFATSSPQRPVIPTTSRRGCASSETEPFA